MGTISIHLVETGQTTLTKTFTLPDAQIDRLVLAYQSAGNTAINGTATRAQVLNAWANSLMASTVQQVSSFEQAVAAALAAAPINPV